MAFKVGNKYKALLAPGAPYKIHVLAIIDENQVVFKYYGRYKQRWHYEVLSTQSLEIFCRFALPLTV